MNKIKNIILSFGLVVGVGLLAVPATVGAVNVFPTCTDNSDTVCASTTGDNLSNYVKTIVDTLLFVTGAISVVTIIVAGRRSD